MFSAKVIRGCCTGISAVLFSLFVAGCGGAQTAVQHPEAVPVKAVRVIQQDVTRANEYAGQVQGKNEVPIQARISGNVVEKMVSGGEIVKKGQPLFRIDSIQYESTLLAAKAQLAQAEANWGNSRTDTERYQSLLNANAISEQQLTTQKATERQNEAVVDSFRALVRKAQDDVNSTLVVSPVDGRLDVNDISVGTYVQAGSTTLVTVGVLDSVFVQFNLSENEYLDLRQSGQQNLANSGWGEEVGITLSNGQVYPLKGKVTQVDRGLADNSGTLTIKASVANPDGILIPGMFTRVRIDGVPVKGAILVPQRSVQQVLDKSFVMVVNAENRTEVRPVALGEKVGGFWLIKEGLTSSDIVIVEGLTKAREGVALEVAVVAPEELGLSVN